MKLMTSQRQTLADLIARTGLEPMSFEWWTNQDGDDVVYLSDADWRFTFGGRNGYSLSWSPGEHKLHEGYGTLHEFNEVLPFFARWLDVLQREAAAVDPWEVRREMVALLGEGGRHAFADDDDEPHTIESQAGWRAALDEMQAHIDDRLDALGQDSGEFKMYVARQFEVLRELLPTKGRRAWRALMRDFLVNIAATATWQLGPAGGQVVIDLVHAGLPAIGLS